MTNRRQVIDRFLRDSPWANWDRQPLAGDASARRYERLTHGDESVILMDDPTGDGENTATFAKIAQMLINVGLSAPRIHAHAPATGLMIIDDLGSDDFSKWLSRHPGEQSTLYYAAADVLIKLHNVGGDLELLQLTPEVGGEMISILNPYYTANAVTSLMHEMTRALRAHAPDANTLALRDFHAENLIWRPQKSDTDRVGLLDFQDALLAPAGYDLISLLRDVRRDVPSQLTDDVTLYFIEKNRLESDFDAQLATLGVQRNLRILGVFARLAQRDKKKRYLSLLPRVWTNLQLDLRHPALTSLRQAVNDTLKPPRMKTLK